MIGRAMLRRCPWCGGKGAWLRGWFGRDDRCRTCGLQWDRRLDGFELGASTVNVVITFGAILVALIGGMLVSAPDIAVWPIVFTTVGIALVGPVLLYPYSQTLWLALDLAMRVPDDDERADWALASATPLDQRRSRSRAR
jgi:uncharacterized protein (DUF983 family)